jgi:hypothetical protein
MARAARRREAAELGARLQAAERRAEQLRVQLGGARAEIDVQARELMFVRAHIAYHHPEDRAMCPWERDIMMKVDRAKAITIPIDEEDALW